MQKSERDNRISSGNIQCARSLSPLNIGSISNNQAFQCLGSSTILPSSPSHGASSSFSHHGTINTTCRPSSPSLSNCSSASTSRPTTPSLGASHSASSSHSASTSSSHSTSKTCNSNYPSKPTTSVIGANMFYSPSNTAITRNDEINSSRAHSCTIPKSITTITTPNNVITFTTKDKSKSTSSSHLTKSAKRRIREQEIIRSVNEAVGWNNNVERGQSHLQGNLSTHSVGTGFNKLFERKLDGLSPRTSNVKMSKI